MERQISAENQLSVVGVNSYSKSRDNVVPICKKIYREKGERNLSLVYQVSAGYSKSPQPSSNLI